MATSSQSSTVTVDGHRIKLTNLDKVLYPRTGTTKRDVLEYFTTVSGPLITHLSGRAVTRKRWVDGVGTDDDPGTVFFRKDLESSAPDWVRSCPIRHRDHTNTYPLVEDLATLTWLGQVAALELHVPQWRFGQDGEPTNPDRLVLDLDPGPGVGLPECAEVARLARRILMDLGLDPVPVTSGSKGIHLYGRLDGSQTSDRASAVAKELARALEADHPDLVISTMGRADRSGKVFIDWSQNNANKTTVSPYSLRGRSTPTVAAPRGWDELDDPDLAQLDHREVARRVTDGIEPMAALAVGTRAGAGDGASRAGTGQAGARGDRLQTYRSMRDATRTPEPVPADAPSDTGGHTFVIQEHHARALHWDFRLERDGVLVSWALPKGVPTDPKRNHLAVQTEDHPLDYGGFEGSIPQGEYGGGEVTIWDSGTYHPGKWHDGREVVATLHGQPDGGLGGSAKFALIHTGSGGDRNWLIHRMELDDDAQGGPEQARGGASAEPVGDYSPMMASLGDAADIDDEREWAFEMKWDGLRALARVGSTGVQLLSRNGNDLTEAYPELAGLQHTLRGGSAVLDGEIVALRDGRPDFGLLQGRMKLTRRSDIERAQDSTPVQLLLFDIVERDGQSLLHTEWQRRRTVLEEAVQPTGSHGPVQVPPVFDGDLAAAIRTSADLGLEGVVAKTRKGRYQSGGRGRTWIKIKHHHTQEVVVIGWRPGQGRRADQVGSLLLALPADEGLHFVGRVGTGFSEQDLTEIGTRLRRLERRTSPVTDLSRADAKGVHWVTPSQVAEVEFSEWTAAGRLRHPSWRGWRPDKDPDEVRLESH